MDAETFTALALRVIVRDASEQDRLALDAELAAVPARREEFEQLRVTYGVLNIALPVVQAGRTYTPELPAHRVGELRTAVRQHFGPAANREKATAGSPTFRFVLRWIFGGMGVAALGFAIAIACFANRTIEIGSYTVDDVRGEKSLGASDVPAAQFVRFDSDAPFDHWQDEPLGWTERAKIWVDNEHDLVHIKHRLRFGWVVTESEPLAPSNEAQREQIKRIVDEMQR